MLNIAENSWITILLASIAIIIGIVVPIVLYRLSKRKKKLICKLFPSLSLVDVRTEVKDKIKIYYDNELVENLSMTKVKIRNNGNLPIRKADIVKPLEFNFGKNLRVIDHGVINTEPIGIAPNLEHNTENNLIRCSFDLLNPGDELTLQFVCLGESKESPIIGARIEGVKQVDVETITISEEVAKRMRKYGNLYIVMGFIMLITVIITYLFPEPIPFQSTKQQGLILYGVFSIIMIMVGILAKKGYLSPKTSLSRLLPFRRK